MNGFLRLAATKAWFVVAVFHPPSFALETDGVVVERVGGRDALVHVPGNVPASGKAALVLVLHGGLGNARRIVARQAEGGMNLNAVADEDGFVVAYLDGTPVTRRLGPDLLGWNAGGGCCGQSAVDDIDDVDYLASAVATLADRHGIDRSRVYAVGHSNGAMMIQRLMCERGVLAAGVVIAGPLNLATDHCDAARGRRILAIHGADDHNVPIAGGRGTKGLSGIAFRSEASSRRVFTDSGGEYRLQVVDGADHRLDRIEAAIERSEGVSLATKVARFLVGRGD